MEREKVVAARVHRKQVQSSQPVRSPRINCSLRVKEASPTLASCQRAQVPQHLSGGRHQPLWSTSYDTAEDLR